jgi:hypothetical protein
MKVLFPHSHSISAMENRERMVLSKKKSKPVPEKGRMLMV